MKRYGTLDRNVGFGQFHCGGGFLPLSGVANHISMLIRRSTENVVRATLLIFDMSDKAIGLRLRRRRATYSVRVH